MSAEQAAVALAAATEVRNTAICGRRFERENYTAEPRDIGGSERWNEERDEDEDRGMF